MAFALHSNMNGNIQRCSFITVLLGHLIIFVFLQQVSSENFSINTDETPKISNAAGDSQVDGKIIQKSFKGPNGGNWNNSVAHFQLPKDKQYIFASDNTVTIHGNNSLLITTFGNFTLGTTLDVSGRLVDGLYHNSLFMVGGFVRTSNSCCVLGAGPGAAFSYHGAGHGGRGGGFYQDRNSSRFYSWDYHDMDYLLGGSTSTVMFASKPGSGGGAIEITTNGTLTINAAIKADGFTSNDTSENHCAGGSAGGLIRLNGTKVIFQANGTLSAKGGNSGRSSNTKRHCGDGGGGGVIQVLSTHDNIKYFTDKNKIQTDGGSGLENGEPGIVFYGVFFDNGILDVNTSECTMKWLNLLIHNGLLSERKYRTPDNNMVVSYNVCTFVFESDVRLGDKSTIKITGKNSLMIESKNGSIQLMTDLNVTGKGVGGFTMTTLTGVNQGPGNVTKCNARGLYEYDFDVLVGGSVCTETKGGEGVDIKGGGAIELRAVHGGIVIGNSIVTDGYSNNDDAGAMGGIIRLRAKEVHLRDTAFLSAKASPKGSNLAGGGIVQIKSYEDVQGMCESKFDVSGGRKGLVNVMTSVIDSYQVQFIQDGSLLVDTTHCTWAHNTKSNVSVVYSQLGRKKDTTHMSNVTVCSFDFHTPIIINGSTEVKLSGEHALSIESKEGIHIGVDLIIDSSQITGMSSFLGGYCAVNATQARKGAGPGKGFPNINAGGGHGGRGGLFRESDNNIVYGRQYGVHNYWLIGGSTGTSKSSSELRGCGGGAIRIASQRNLTIAAKIQVNGYANSTSGPTGGSSGGSIILEGQQVILTATAELEAKGSNATSNVNTGGGAGGVIVINNTVDNIPEVTIATAGGHGYKPGECGVVIVNGKVHRKPYNPDVQEIANFIGCRYKAEKPQGFYRMLEHEALPITCLEHCKEKASSFALINGKSCYCVAEIVSVDQRSNDACNKSCPATYKYRCGGAGNNLFSVYKTGITQVVSPTEESTVEPTKPPFDKPSEKLEVLNNVSINKQNANEVALHLNKLIINTTMNGGDTRVVVNIMNKLSRNVLAPNNSNETKQIGQAIIDTASILLGSKNSENWKKMMSSNKTETYTPNNVLDVIEKIGIDLGSGLEPEEHVALESNHLVMGIERRDLSSYIGGIYPPYQQLSEVWQFEDSISVPEESIAELTKLGANHTTVVFVLYSGISEALNSNLASDRMINSRVLSLKFGHDFLEPFVKPVNITLTKKQNWENLTDTQCSFLDFTNSSQGNWSNRGCVMTSSEDDTKVQCQCNHLTNFAVLMQVKEFKVSRYHQKALEMITYIGCGISLFGLALTLATFLSLETLASERTSIHKNLVVAIGLAQIIFLAGIDAVYNPIACKVVALALHYLYMAAFTWMCCEGIHLYTKVIEVFSSETSKMKYYYMLGWGAPLIIVIISAASRIQGYGTQTACWISIKDGLIWAFVGPVLIIMCINFVVMVMVIKVILASVTSIQSPGNTSQVKAGLKGMVVLLPLLGLTWVFGLMAVNEKTIAFQYVFAVLNSLQGLFIFAFHCIGNSEVRVAYKRLHEKRTLNKMPEHSLSSGNHHKTVEDFKRRMNSRETNSTGDEDIIVTKAIRSVSDVKLSGGQDHVAMQTFGDADSGRWSLNCPSPDPPCVSYLPPPSKSPRREPRAAPTLTDVPQQAATPRESYRSNRNNIAERNRFVKGEAEGQINGYQRF